MGDVSAEPSMEDILSSIKRIIAEDGDAPSTRARRPASRPVGTADLTGRRAPDPEPQDEVLELNEPAPTEPPAPVEPARPAADAILSRQAAAASRDSLQTLSRLVVKPAVEGTDTLEGMVREMLRPMLREWLDAHLPELVEAMVAREIARITTGR